MRHRVYGKKLGRNKNERTALFKSLVQELFLHGSITTTQAKAKSIKGLVDKIITLAKNKNSQRLLQAFFTNKALEERVIKEITPKLGNRVSGYTSLVKMGIREGDRSLMVKMNLIGAEKLKPLEKESRIKNNESRKITKEQKKTIEKQVSKATIKAKPTIKRSKKA